jgi:hypothetical protein
MTIAIMISHRNKKCLLLPECKRTLTRRMITVTRGIRKSDARQALHDYPP